MADEIIDNRILLTANDTTDASLDDQAGSAVGSSDTENFIEGDGSWGVKVSQTVTAMMYDAGSAQDWSNNTFYIWAKCSFPIDTFAAGGMRIRFCGATVTDYFEKHVRGVDTGYSGGFTMVVADIERAREDAIAGTDGGTGGTTPATNAIRYVGIVFDVPGMVSGNFNNCNVDAMWRLPNSDPGIKVDGRNGGSAWTMNDIFNAGDPGDATKAWGSVFFEDGVYKLNTPVKFANNDSEIHSFSDSNIVVAWIDALVANNFYGWAIEPGSGNNTFSLGFKSGTGDDATGSQGMTMVADTSGARFDITANNGSIDFANFYGCQFLHGDVFTFNHANTSVISCLFNDISSVNAAAAGDFLRNTTVNANTFPNEQFITINNMDDLAHGINQFSSSRGGHAIKILQTGATGSVGNRFTDYDADGTANAAIFNDSGGAVTINVSGGGLASEHTVRNGSGSSTSVVATVDINVNVQDSALNPIANAQVYIQKASPTLFTPNANNGAGNVAIQMQQVLDTDIPQSTWAIVLDRSLNRTFPYRVASHTANTLSLRTEVTGTISIASNSTYLVTAANLITSDIEEGDTVRNTTDGSYGVIDEILNPNTAVLFRGLEGGTDNTWQDGDTWSVHRLATALEAGVDHIDVPLFNGQTDTSGDIVTVSYDQSAAPTSIIVRTRTVQDAIKYISDFRTGTISATSGYTQTITLQEDSEAT